MRVYVQQMGEYRSRQDVTALGGAVAENAVVEQVIGFAVVFTEKRRIEGL